MTAGRAKTDDFDRKRFDLTPIRVIRTEIDPIHSWEAMRWAAERAFHLGYDADEIDEGLCVWLCFTSGAETERALSPPRPRGFVSSMPEIWRSASDLRFAQNARIEAGIDEFDGERRTFAPRPTSRDLQRWEEASRWLRFVHGDRRDRDQKILWLRAQGVGYGQIARATGLSSKVCANIRSDQLRRIASRLATALAKHGLHLRDIL